MRKFLLFLLVLAALAYFGLLPFSANDVSRLLPVETVLITREGDRIRVDVGAGVRAVGKSLAETLDRLKEQVSGVIFFQTAEQVIVEEQAAQVVDEVISEERFRPAAGIYLTPERDLDAQAVSRYCSARHTALTLGEAKAAQAEGRKLVLPRLIRADGGFRILV